ncbi:hypothetical protein IQ272_24735 [Chroococcidiopsidales cyanobacterium LEGE 13417]|nr:hypothetical protein [Chroococcidiopsidales cyanobacterium LEGE 13417]
MKIKFLSLLGAAFALTLSSHAAFAQEAAKEPPEIKLSEEGKKILCEKFPLNSRCPGGQPLTGGAPTGTEAAPDATTPEAAPAPDATTPETAPAPDGTMPTDPGTAPAPDGTMPTDPGTAPAPDGTMPTDPGTAPAPDGSSPTTPGTEPAPTTP